MTDFEAGKSAYYDSRDDLYFGASDEFKEGYKDAWYANNQLADWQDPSGQHTDTAWSHHEGSIDFDQSAAFASIHEEAAKKFAYKQLTAQVCAFLLGAVVGGIVIGSLADFGLTIATAVYGGAGK